MEAYHAQGIGYGVLAQFYSIADARCGTNAGYTVAQLVALQQAGIGMGEIRKQALGTAANACSLGKLKQAEIEAADQEIDAAQQEKQRLAKQQQAKTKKEQEQREKKAKQEQQPKTAEQHGGGNGKGGGKGK